MSKIALITGITGQDGSYLAELLLAKKYKVHGLVRRVAAENEIHRLWRIKHILKKITLHPASLENYASIVKLIHKLKPNEIYHLGAQSYIDYAFKDEFSTLDTNINGTHHILSAIKDFSPKTKMYFAASSEMYGKVLEIPQTEKTPFYPRSTYGISKIAGFDLTRNYREAYSLFCASGILFNHESPRRGFEFVTRKISHSVAKIKYGLQKELRLGNVNAKRDWGHAKDYVFAMWLMMQQKKPDDFVICTGVQYSVKDFTKLAFEIAGLDYKKYLQIDKSLNRPADVQTLLGDYSKAKRILKWKHKFTFKDLVRDMVISDLDYIKKTLLVNSKS
jgi:GDPmannose 4,6-dehydratase